jgi:lysophospholipase L1-like esterase
MKQFQLIIFIILSLIFMEQSIIAQNNQLLKDWPNLNRYREENTRIGLPTENENRIVFMGNSITEGWLKICPAFFSGKPYINRGISGQTTPQMLVRFRQDVVNLKPKVVVILAGTNDIAENTGPSTLEMIEDNILSMAEIAKANDIKVILCSVLPAYDYPWKPGLNPAEKIVKLNKWIKNYSDNNHIIYVDYFTPMADERNGLNKKYSEDGVHPNKAGYEVMAPIVEKGIVETLDKL